VLQRKFDTALRYKTHSGPKWLILKGLLLRHFFRFASQALDFAGLPGHRSAAINKVIHTIRAAGLNAFKSKT
jgi:hypothetical protein